MHRQAHSARPISWRLHARFGQANPLGFDARDGLASPEKFVLQTNNKQRRKGGQRE
jgi:hypothetical protein